MTCAWRPVLVVAVRGVARGERVGTSRVTAQQVQEMRRRAALGQVTQHELAREFGLRQSTVSAILTRTTWRHVPITPEEAATGQFEGDEANVTIDTGTGRIQRLARNGRVLATYADIRQAELATGIDRLVIAAACNSGGHGWRYEPGPPPSDLLYPWGDVVVVRYSGIRIGGPHDVHPCNRRS